MWLRCSLVTTIRTIFQWIIEGCIWRMEGNRGTEAMESRVIFEKELVCFELRRIHFHSILISLEKI